MHASDLFPFLSLLPAHKIYATPSIPIDRVLLFPDVKALPKQVLDLYAPMCNMIYFKNIDVYVPNTNCLGELVSTYRELINPTREKPTWLISEVNPNFIDIEESGFDIYLVRQIGGSYRIKISENLEYFKALIGKVDVKPYLLSNPSLATFQSGDVVAESKLRPDSKVDMSNASVTTIFGTFEELKIYLESGTSENARTYKAVPLLVGHTGVSKSAIIKSIVETTSSEYGLRLVDIRVSFMDKLDFTGVMELLDTREGEQFAEAPIRELVTASDSFLKTVRGFLNDSTLLEKLKQEPEVYSKLIELSKTPVLVFEEVNRCESAIRQVLTSLLNTKKFLSYTFSEARVVATANLPVGTDKEAVELMGTDFYDADGFGDAAYRKRFIFIEVDPTANTASGKSVRASWLNWAYGPPVPRTLVKISDSYAKNKNYTELNVKQDVSIVNQFAVVDGPVSKDFKDESQIQFSIYLCDTTPEILASLSSSKNLQKFIEDTISKNKFFIVFKDDLVEFNPKTNSIKLNSDNSVKKFSNANLHPLILKYLNTVEGQGDAYNLETVLKAVPREEVAKYRLIPLTSFRSWEFASNILKMREKESKDGKIKFYPEAFKGMMDQETVKRFVKFLKSNGCSELKTKNTMTDMLNEGVNSGVPVLLIGASSTGKTGRVNQMAIDNDMIMVPIVLSATDKTMVKGFPVPSDPIDAIFTPGAVEKSNVLQIFSDYYKGNKFSIGEMVSVVGHEKGNAFKVMSVASDGKYEVQEYDINTQGKETETVGKPLTVSSSEIHVERNLPKKISYNAQSADLVKTLNTAKALNKKILFFVDEINRVTSPVTMSCILEAISDKKVMGIDFSDVNMTVVAACNVGDAHVDAIALDPALVARFLTVKKDEADKEDYDAFMLYAETAVKKGKLNPVVLDALKKLGATDADRYAAFSKLFFEPETQGTQDRVFSSTRLMGVLSNFLESDTLKYPIKGKRIAKDIGEFKTRLENSSSSQEFFAGWLGQAFDKPIKIADASGNEESFTVTGKDGVINVLQESGYFNKPPTLSKSDKKEIEDDLYAEVVKFENHFVTARAEMVQTWLNVDPKIPAMKTFMKAFNEACDGSLEWGDLVNSELVLEYFMTNYAASNTKMSLQGDFATLFKKAVLVDFKGYVPVDYAKWFIALYKFLDSRNVGAELDAVVGKTIGDKEVYELLRGTVDNAATDLLEKSLPNI